MAPCAGETLLFESSFGGPSLEDGWRWIREDSETSNFGTDGLDFRIQPGGLWGQIFAGKPSPPLLLRPVGEANAFEVTVIMPPTVGSYGEQAGLFLYVDDNNYAKLVVEWMKDGTASVVLACEKDGHAEVSAKAGLDTEEAHEPIRLRLELSADGSQISGVLVSSYYNRLIGSCPADRTPWCSSGSDPTMLSVGIGAHGSSEEDSAERMARFSKFAAIAVKANRVQWGGGASVPPHIACPHPESTSPLHGDYCAPAPGSGLTLSEDLTSEQRAQIMAMLAGAQMAGRSDEECDERLLHKGSEEPTQ
eukprot:TRINITY_DN70842_c0_g1_i1.p1 TRINITY_DN70842_c0_g1~~TRINITY_DN70842_c0_g1_i1.p1  ORF type:complete len:306 (-),score=45.08 TRINITY_DN70842_c0_g1_i1:42-959(-)